jgi:hypothetical protein
VRRHKRNAFGEPESPEAKKRVERERKFPTGYEHEVTGAEYFAVLTLIAIVLTILVIFVR